MCHKSLLRADFDLVLIYKHHCLLSHGWISLLFPAPKSPTRTKNLNISPCKIIFLPVHVEPNAFRCSCTTESWKERHFRSLDWTCIRIIGIPIELAFTSCRWLRCRFCWLVRLFCELGGVFDFSQLSSTIDGAVSENVRVLVTHGACHPRQQIQVHHSFHSQK